MFTIVTNSYILYEISQISHANSMSPTETGTLSLTTISTTETSRLDNQTSFSCRSDNINGRSLWLSQPIPCTPSCYL
ncbi:hypothetical protein WN943_006725 [Citrus x changshan-huyou]